MFTDIELNTIENKKNDNINKLKILLANEATSMLHGKKASSDAEKTAKDTFEKKISGKNLPVTIISKKKISLGINILEFIVNTKILNSKSEAKRAIKNKGIRINNITIINDKEIINLKYFEKDNCKISFGKKKHIVVKLD